MQPSVDVVETQVCAKKAGFGCAPAHGGHWCPEELSGLMLPEQDQPQHRHSWDLQGISS